MILIGQFDSPFVRRVGIALTMLDMPFEHRPWSVFGDGEKLMPINPLMRVPTLILDDGDTILDSYAMIDHIDNMTSPGRTMLPREEPARRRAMRTMSMALGMAEHAVSLFYEQRLHETASPTLSTRRTGQIVRAADALEAERAAVSTPFWRGHEPGHEDVAVAACFAFVREAHPGMIEEQLLPNLTTFSERAEALPAFKAVHQPFKPPA